MSTTVAELVGRLGLDVEESQWKKGDAWIERLNLGLVALGTVVTGAVVGLVGLVKSTADAGDAARKLAQSTGVDSITLQKLGYAAELAGVSTDELATGLRHLAKTGVKDIQGEMLRLSERFKSMPNDGAKVALAMEKFGRAGARMIPLLNGGRKELSALMQEAEDLGIVMSEEDQKAAEEFNDQLLRLSTAAKGFGRQLGTALLRPLTAVATWLFKLMKDIRASAPWVKKVEVAFKGLAVVLGGVLLAALIANSAAIVTAISWYAALGAAAVMAGLKAAAAWLAAIAPVALLAAALALAILVVEDFYTMLEGGDSVIGKLGLKWAKFLDSFMKPLPSDPPWLKTLKSAVEIMAKLDDLQWKLAGKIFGGPVAPQDPNAPFATRFSELTSNLQNAWQGPRFGGGAASPQAAAAGAPSTNIIAPNINAPITVHASPGMNVNDLAGKVAQHIDERIKDTIRGAAAGMGQ